jgi:hypothetical protein
MFLVDMAFIVAWIPACAGMTGKCNGKTVTGDMGQLSFVTRLARLDPLCPMTVGQHQGRLNKSLNFLK